MDDPMDERVDGPLAGARPADPAATRESFAELAARGLALLEEGQAEMAREPLERAFALRSDDPDVTYALGVIYGRRALEELARSNGLFRDETGVEALLARAIFCYQRSVEVDPRRAEPWNNLAALYALRGDREQAIEALRRSLGIEPDQPEVRDRLEELGAF